MSLLSWCPADVIYLLALRLEVKTLYTTYTQLPEFRCLDDPHHRVWKELFHRDLSSYPLEDTTLYREQYFWAQLTELTVKQRSLLYAQMGYDRGWKHLTRYKRGRKHMRAVITAAVEGGYLNIVKPAFDAPSCRGLPEAMVLRVLNVAARKGHRDVYDYLATKVTLNPNLLGELSWAACHSTNLPLIQSLIQQTHPNPHNLGVYLAVVSRVGHPDIVDYLLSVYSGAVARLGDKELKPALEGAALGGHIDLMERYRMMGVRVRPSVVTYAICKGHYDAVEWLLGWVGKLGPSVLGRLNRHHHPKILELVLEHNTQLGDELTRREFWSELIVDYTQGQQAVTPEMVDCLKILMTHPKCRLASAKVKQALRRSARGQNPAELSLFRLCLSFSRWSDKTLLEVMKLAECAEVFNEIRSARTWKPEYEKIIAEWAQLWT